MRLPIRAATCCANAEPPHARLEESANTPLTIPELGLCAPDSNRADTQPSHTLTDRRDAHGYDHKRPAQAAESAVTSGRRTQCSPVDTGL